MATVFAQNVIEVAVVATYATRPVVNVLHLFNDEAGGSDATKIQDFANNWQDHMLDELSNQYQLVHFAWRSLDPNDTNVGVLQPDPAKPTQGASTAEGAPPNVAILVHKNTANRPRGRRDGRMFLAGIPEASVNPVGNIETPKVTGINTALQAFYDGITDSGLSAGSSGLCVLETTPQSRAPGTQAVTVGWREVTSLTCDLKVATQRERLR